MEDFFLLLLLYTIFKLCWRFLKWAFGFGWRGPFLFAATFIVCSLHVQPNSQQKYHIMTYYDILCWSFTCLWQLFDESECQMVMITLDDKAVKYVWGWANSDDWLFPLPSFSPCLRAIRGIGEEGRCTAARLPARTLHFFLARSRKKNNTKQNKLLKKNYPKKFF